jgi:ATP-dependent RNA helicase DHX29
MPKKKKTQLKPVARGFAVTSIPKKAPPEPPPPSQHDSDANGESASSEVPLSAQTHEPVEDEALIPQNTEERSLQDLVDKLQERVEKEIVRTVKVRGDVARGLDLLIRRPSLGH